MYNLQFDEKGAQWQLEGYEKQLAEIADQFALLEDKKKYLIRMMKEIKKQLQAAKTKVEAEVGNPPAMPAENGYHPNWTFEQKVDFVLKNASAALTTRQVVEGVMMQEPTADRQRMMRGISSVLSVKSGHDGKYLKDKNERNENTYLIRQMFYNKVKTVMEAEVKAKSESIEKLKAEIELKKIKAEKIRSEIELKKDDDDDF